MSAVAVRLYRALLALYPETFRRAVGERLLVDFRQGLVERDGAGSRAAFTAREVADLLRNLPGAWRDAHAEESAQQGRGSMMDGTLQDLAYAWRSMRRRPGFAAVVVLTLALGIGASAAVFGVIKGVLLDPLPYPDSDQLVYMYESYRGDQTRSVSYPNFLDWRARNHVYSDVAARTFWTFTLTGAGQAEILNGIILSANTFPLLGIEPVAGRLFTEEEELHEDRVVLLSSGVWARLFGSDPSVVGRALTLNDEPWTVVGVLPPGLEFPVQADVYAPLTTLSDGDQNSRGSRPGIAALARLRPGTALADAQRDMDGVAAQLEAEYPDADGDAGIVVRSLRDRYLGGATPVLTPLAAAVALVFLIACANVANLFLVRGQTRRREAAVRTALGGRRGRVARTYLAEAGLLAAGGGVLGVALAKVGIGVLRQLSTTGVPRLARAEVDTTVLLFTLATAVLATLLVGVLPALRLSSIDPARELVEGGVRGSTTAGGRLRAGLVVAEVGLSFVLLVGSGLMLRSMANLTERDPGFDPTDVLTIGLPIPGERYPTPADRARFFDRVAERMTAMPGVTAVAGGDPLPMGGNNRQMGTISEEASAAGEDELRTDWYAVTSNYFSTMGIRFIEGSTFDPRQDAEAPSAVVDSLLAARFWPGESALGRRLRFGGGRSPWFTVVGVVRHVNSYGPRTEGREQIFVPQDVRMFSQNLVIESRREPGDLVAEVRTIITDVDPDVPLGAVATMGSLVDGAVAAERLATRALGLFGAAAFGLAMLGLYGVVSYTVSLRAREIGIRMALGARAGGMVRRITGWGLGLAALGVFFGALGALAGSRLLDALLFDVAPADPATLVSVAVVLLAVSGVAAAVPAGRASHVQPASTLQAE